jgi:hypothetical protein
MKLIRYSDRPELWARSGEITDEVWPEYNQHGDVTNAYWGTPVRGVPLVPVHPL